jgi:ribosomal protein S18 acetylase RimI-like enzyme
MSAKRTRAPAARNRASKSITIREMELEDLPSIFALGERLFTSDLWPNLYRTWDEDELVDMFSVDRETCLVADRDGTIVGFVLGSIISKRRSAWIYGYVVWLAVHPRYRRRGLAQRLLERLTELFVREGVRIILTDTDANNTAAVEFFERQGFGNRTDHVYLMKNLSRRAKRSPRGRSSARRSTPRAAAR